jgi:UrcA family protein
VRTHKILCIWGATIVGSLLTIGATSPARSQQPLVVEAERYHDPETQRVVHYGDLNLADMSGRSLLIRRVDYAVNDLCSANEGRRALERDANIRGCSKSAWNSASPQITAAFERAKSGSFVAAAAVTITSGQ